MKVKKLVITSVFAAFMCLVCMMLVTPQNEKAAAFNSPGGILSHMAYNNSAVYDFNFDGIEEDIVLDYTGETTVWIRFEDWQVYAAAGNLESSFITELEYFDDVYMEFYLIIFDGNEYGQREIYLPIYRDNYLGSFGYLFNFNSYFVEFMEQYGWSEIFIAVCMQHDPSYSSFTPKFRFDYSYIDYGQQLWRYTYWDEYFPEYVNPDAYAFRRFKPDYTGEHILRYTGDDVNTFLELLIYEGGYDQNNLTDGYNLPYPVEFRDYNDNAEHLSYIYLDEEITYYIAIPIRYFEETSVYPLSIHRLGTIMVTATDEYFDEEIVYYYADVWYSGVNLVASNCLTGDSNPNTEFIAVAGCGMMLSTTEIRGVNQGEYLIRSKPSMQFGHRYVYSPQDRGRILIKNHEIHIYIEEELIPVAPFRYGFQMIHSNNSLQPINKTIYFTSGHGIISIDFPVEAYPFFFASGNVEFYMDIVIKDWSHSFLLKAGDGNTIPFTEIIQNGYRTYRFKFDSALKQRLENFGSYFVIELNGCLVSPLAINFQMSVY